MRFPIVMGGYAIHDRKGVNEAIKILEALIFLKDRPWKYDPHFVMVAEKGKKRHGPEDHERRLLEESLENKESWEEMEAIIAQQLDPTMALDHFFPNTHPNKLEPQPNKPSIP